MRVCDLINLPFLARNKSWSLSSTPINTLRTVRSWSVVVWSRSIGSVPRLVIDSTTSSPHGNGYVISTWPLDDDSEGFTFSLNLAGFCANWKPECQYSKECMCHLGNIACDYQEIVTTGQTNGRTDRKTDAGQSNPYLPLYASQVTQKVHVIEAMYMYTLLFS